MKVIDVTDMFMCSSQFRPNIRVAPILKKKQGLQTRASRY